MLDLVAIAQSAPGAIAVNGAIVVGYKLAGMLGAVVAIVATIIPPFLIISVISVFYEAFRHNFIVSQMLAGMQAGVGAVIASVVWEMGRTWSTAKAPPPWPSWRGPLRPPASWGSMWWRWCWCAPASACCGSCWPAGKGAQGNDLPSAVSELFADRAVQLWGGYAAIPLIQGQIVDQHGWLSMAEFTDLITISQMTPGPHRPSTRPPLWASRSRGCRGRP